MIKKRNPDASTSAGADPSAQDNCSAAGPDFLLIGAARSGTTWLYQRLRLQRSIFVTPVKEIHYFDIYRRYSPWHWIRVRRMLLHLRRYCIYLFDRSGRNSESIPWLLKWGLNYFLMPKSHAWYRSLFRDQHGRIAGELTPAYALLDESCIAEVASINPGVRIIFQMRDPIDRAWSQTVMHLSLHRRPGAYEQYLDEIRTVVFRDEIINRSMYLETIDKWEKHIPRENICYLFFDDIEQQPSSMLDGLFAFLGAESGSEDVYRKDLTTRVGERDSQGRKIPAEIEKELAQIFYPMLTALERRFGGGYPGVWKMRAQLLLD